MEVVPAHQLPEALQNDVILWHNATRPERYQGRIRVPGRCDIEFEGVSDFSLLAPLVTAFGGVVTAHPELSITKAIFKEGQDVMVVFFRYKDVARNFITHQWSREDTAGRLTQQFHYVIESCCSFFSSKAHAI
jgi:hypothetical protein